MNYELKAEMPEWHDHNEVHDLVLSNDIDSLASCALLKKVKGWDIKYFYDFNRVYRIKDYKGNNEKCWVDVAIKSGHAFDNHVSRLTLMDDWNEDMINLNTAYWVTNENYCDKYAGSTLLEIWSLYDVPLPKTEKGKMLLLAIDVAFKGFYSDKFHDTQKHYLCHDLEFDELYKVIERHTRDEFYDLIAEYGLNADIKIKDGKLTSKLRLDEIGKLLELELQLPTEVFKTVQILEIVDEKVMPYYNTTEDVCPRLVTMALTYRNNMRYSKEWLT